MDLHLPSTTPEHELRRTQTFLRRVARGLSLDESSAEDLVQEAWVSALRQQELPSRGWFARALRHLAINRREESRRRAYREASVARPEAIAGPEEALAALELGQSILRAVEDLPEAQRTAILLRYWSGFAPSEIAEALNVPLATVKARLARSRALLRERLGERRSDRAAWAFMTGAARKGGDMSLVQGFKFGALATAGVVSGSVLLGAWRSQDAPSSGNVPVREEERSPRAAQRPAPVVPASVQEGESRRVALAEVAARSSSSEPPVQAEPSGRRVAGRVIDPEGRPLAGVRVLWHADWPAEKGVPDEAVVGVMRATEPARQQGSLKRLVALFGDRREDPGAGNLASSESSAARTAISDAAGAFVFEDFPRFGRVVIEDERWVGASWSWVAPAAKLQPAYSGPVVVAAPVVPVTGRVLDPHGRPLPQVELRFRPPEDFLDRLGIPRGEATALTQRSFSAPDGSFAFPLAPGLAGASLTAELEGFVSAEQALGDWRESLTVTLERPPVDSLLRGRVVNHLGEPAAGARVSLGGAETRSDDAGRFVLDARSDHPDHANWMGRLGSSRTLVAVQLGYLPGEYRADLDVATGDSAAEGALLWPDEILLRLGPPALAIEGRVVDEAGRAVPDAIVGLERATWFSGVGGGQSLESSLAGTQARWPHVDADSEGRFELGGLLDDDYRLVATNPATLERVVSDPIRAGTRQVELVLDSANRWESVSGRVITEQGHPVAGAQVVLFSFGSDLYHEGRYVRRTAQGMREVETDADGRFMLEAVGKHGCELDVRGPGILREKFGRDLGDRNAARLADVELVVARSARARIVLEDPEEADSYAVLRVDASRTLRRGPLRSGRSAVVEVPAGEMLVVLYRSEEEVRRFPVRFDPDVMNTVP